MDDEAHAICSSGNGYYYVGGLTQMNAKNLIKINELGDSLWSKTITEVGWIRAIISTPDHGCILAGFSDQIRIVRLDSNGGQVWAVAYGGIETSIIRDIKKTSDGNYIACGLRFSSQYGIVIKFNGNGSLLWLKNYPTGALKSLSSIDELPNGGYIVGGSNKDSANDTNKALLMRIDQTGNIVWEKKYKVFNKSSSGGFVKKLPTSFFLAGRTSDTANVVENTRIFFLRTDTSGNVTFMKFYPYYKQDLYTAAQFINNNRFVISSFAVSQLYQDTSAAKVIIIDTLGNILASKNFYAPSLLDNQFFSIIVAQNRDIILAGYQGVLWRAEDFLVCRVDSMLNGPPIGIRIITNEVPKEFKVNQNYPNPFNSSTILKLELPKSGKIRIKVCDIIGKEIKSLNYSLEHGIYEINLDMNEYPSGVYFLRIQFESTYFTKKIILLK